VLMLTNRRRRCCCAAHYKVFLVHWQNGRSASKITAGLRVVAKRKERKNGEKEGQLGRSASRIVAAAAAAAAARHVAIGLLFSKAAIAVPSENGLRHEEAIV